MKAQAHKGVVALVAGVAVLGAILAAGPLRRGYHAIALQRDLARLVNVAATQVSISSRLSIAAAPRRVVVRSGVGGSKPRALDAAALTVLERATRVDSAASVQAMGVAHYYTGETESAVRELERVAVASPSAAAWNDVAAARLERSKDDAAVLDVVAALVAVEKALQADPTFPAALYNRAVILERMGLHGLAREAWRPALVAETDPEWSAEIRKRIESIPSEIDESLAAKALNNLRVEEPGEVLETVDRFPQQARRLAEISLPLEWAAAMVKGDADLAESRLLLARPLADELRGRSNETLAGEAIAAIDKAAGSGDADRVTALVSAYSAYGQGRALLGAHDFARAELQFGEAEKRFARAGSPMANLARYRQATAILEQNRLEEAAAMYTALAQGEHASRGHRGFAADLAWQIARTEGLRGHWDVALQAAQSAVDGYRALGEVQNAGFMENMLAELYDFLGQPEKAWKHRFVAFDRLSIAGGGQRLQVALGAASRVPIRRNDWPAALALLDLEVAVARDANEAVQLSDALARRSRVRAAAGDLPGAREDVASARAFSLRVKDPQERAQVIAPIDIAAGVAERNRDPVGSVRSFTKAIDFYRQSSRWILLPELYLERGRVQLARGSLTEAQADFKSGIDQLEEQRTRVSDFELHSTVGDVGEELLVEAVRVAVRKKDAAAAYQLVERSRGRALLSRLASGNVGEPTSVQDSVRVVEFMVLPEKLIVFTVDRELRMTELEVDHAGLAQMVEVLTSRIIDGSSLETVQRASGALYDAVLRPLGDLTADVSTLVFVSSGVLERVPWAVLYDGRRKRYVIEGVSVTSAPSATVYTLLAAKQAPSTRCALIVGNPKIASPLVDLPELRGAENEARAIARLYERRTLLLGAEATIDRVLRAAETCQVLHFASHAVSSEALENQSFLLLAPDRAEGDSRLLYSRDIAELKLDGVSLVVLAACGTIRGPTVHVDGMPSIGRSFIAAGAKAVLGTLWDLDDDRSVRMFERIHQGVSRGIPVAQVVRETQVDALRSGDPATAHPKSWGGLTLVGDIFSGNSFWRVPPSSSDGGDPSAAQVRVSSHDDRSHASEVSALRSHHCRNLRH